MKSTVQNTDIYKRIKDLGVVLPKASQDNDHLCMIRPFSQNLLYISGMGSTISGEAPMLGKIPNDISIEKGIVAARNAALNAISVLHEYTGDLNRIKSIIKLLAFVSSDSSFCDQHIVVNGASQLLIDVFGTEIGKSARSAVGVASLPLNFPVEIEMIVEIRN